MQSTYHGAEHEAIRAVKEPLVREAREFLSNRTHSRVSAELDKLIPHAHKKDPLGSGIFERLITNTLTQSERQIVRGMAGITPKRGAWKLHNVRDEHPDYFG